MKDIAAAVMGVPLRWRQIVPGEHPKTLRSRAMTWKRFAEQAFRHPDGSEVKIIGDEIEYAENGQQQRIAVVGFSMPEALRLRIFARELHPWIVYGIEQQQPMSDADRTMVLERIAEAYRTGGYEVKIEPP